MGRHRLPAPQWVRLHYCHSRAGAAPAIDVATTLYKAAQSPGGRHRLRDARMGRMADPFGAGSRCRSYFPVNQLIELQYSVLLAAAPALPSPFQGLTHSSARSRGHPIVAVVQCDWTTVCCFDPYLKVLAEGQSPPQELEVIPCSGLYLLVQIYKYKLPPSSLCNKGCHK